jgi:hypothetical protein
MKRVVILIFCLMSGLAYGQVRGGAATTSTPQAMAPIDLTGYWVAVISEDWRWRMVTPARGDYASIPLTQESKDVADKWDPAKDEAAGEQCRSYGPPGLMRGPTRLHVTWQDAKTLKLETDYGQQTRLFHFDGPPKNPGPATWQGVSVAEWVVAGRGGAGSMKSMTTHLRPGYLRKNGVPYSANTVLTEYWDVHTYSNGDQWLILTSVVDDPMYLQSPWITALNFKKERDGSKWDPMPCSAKF